MKPELVLIAAVARNGVIGDGQRLLWRLPEDMRFFRESTRGHPVIMGRKTWDSVPERFRPLPVRRNLVVTRQPAWQAAGAETQPSLAAALHAVAGAPRVFVIGGAELYAAALPLADELLLTEIDRDFEGNTRFPPFDRHAFIEAARETHRAAPPNDFDFSFVSYRRQP
jgi:dihydrofolate reductase